MSNQDNEHRVVHAPTDFSPLIGAWVWALEEARSRTKQCLVDLSQEELDWIPPAGGNNIATLLYHLVAIEMSYLYEDILGVGWAPELEHLLPYDVRDELEELTAVRGESLEKHLQRLDGGRVLLLRTLHRMSEDDFRAPRRVDEYEITPEWVCFHLTQHEAEHRGQIGMIRMR